MECHIWAGLQHLKPFLRGKIWHRSLLDLCLLLPEPSWGALPRSAPEKHWGPSRPWRDRVADGGAPAESAVKAGWKECAPTLATGAGIQERLKNLVSSGTPPVRANGDLDKVLLGAGPPGRP